ncbi:MAG: DNA topoisomerase I [archaeon]
MPESYELIITEKPNAMKKIAESLADGKPIKESNKGIAFYRITHGKQDIVVSCAVGHLFTVSEKEKSFTYPVYDITWKASADVDKKAAFTKKYVDTLKKLAKDASAFTVATDYDIEGEVIGLNCIRYACKQKDAQRMKFSTLTKEDLIESYAQKSKTLDWGQAIAGETRHVLDWYYGINLSRALMLALKKAKTYRTLSVGRVQGPTLKLLTVKEKEIQAFTAEPFWQLEARGTLNKHALIAQHATDKFTDEKTCKAVLTKTSGKDGKVTAIDRKKSTQAPPFPFDLTSLQTEAYRLFRIPPKDALDIAQGLYTGGFISYPRTSSQQLPASIGYQKILSSLAKQPQYKQLVDQLLKQHSPLKPSEGKKTDPAHPAIYPTGHAHVFREREGKIYDLIVKRFLSCFSSPAERETVSISIDIAGEPFIAKGTRTTIEGWHAFYQGYVKLEEQELPAAKEGDVFKTKSIDKLDKMTQPPKRFTPASVIKELEKRNLGTKSTRAAVIESLYQRGYIEDESIKVTDFGMKTAELLTKYVPEIVDDKLTRHFEVEMEKIRRKQMTAEQVLDEAKQTLTKILTNFQKKEKAIGEELKEALQETREKESYIGPCPICKQGTLRIMMSKKFKKRFIACDKYPDCEATFNIPVFGIIKSLPTPCAHCSYPQVLVISGRRKREACINPDCPAKKSEDKKAQKEADGVASGKIVKKCPKCGGNLLLRKSIYGQFYGCSTFPKCRHIEKIV